MVKQAEETNIVNVQGPWNLPQGWKWIPLAEPCEIQIGGTPRRNNPNYWGQGNTWVSIADLNDGLIAESKEEITDLGVSESNVKLIEPGTVLVSFKLTIGKLGIAGKRLYTNEAIAALPIKNDWKRRLFAPYLFNVIKALPLSDEVDLAVKGKTLNKQKLARILLPIPFPNNYSRSFATQRRIVARIESLLAEVKESRKLLNKMQHDANRVMAAAISELEYSVIDGTVINKLITVLEEKPRNGWSPKCDDNPNGVPVLKLGAVLNFRYDPAAVKYTSLHINKDAHYWLNPGDILISRSNTIELVGNAAVYTGNPSPCIYPDLIMRMRPNRELVDGQFIAYWLRTPLVRHYIRTNASGASSTMKKITQRHVCEIPFPELPLTAQRQWITRLNSIQAEIDEISRMLKADAQLLAQLEQSILERAFRGEI